MSLKLISPFFDDDDLANEEQVLNYKEKYHSIISNLNNVLNSLSISTSGKKFKVRKRAWHVGKLILTNALHPLGRHTNKGYKKCISETATNGLIIFTKLNLTIIECFTQRVKMTQTIYLNH